MILPSRFGSWLRGSAADAADARFTAVMVLLALTTLLCTGGCAMFGRGGPTSEQAAVCLGLTQQGAAAMQLGQWEQAESLLREAVEASSEDGQTRRHLAEVLWHRGSVHEAMTQIAAAVRLAPEDATILVRAGEMALATGARDAALHNAEQAIRLHPQLAAAWALRGRVFRQTNQPERALADLQRALEFAPDDAQLLLELALIYRQRGQSNRCLTTLLRLHDTYPSGAVPQTALLLEGSTLMELGRPQQAAEVLILAAQQGPPSADVLFNLARAQSAAGRYADATASVQQALVIDASHQGSQQLLAQLAVHATPADTQRR